MIESSKNSHNTRMYLHARDKDRLHVLLKEKRSSLTNLNTGSIQPRIALGCRIGCLLYALDAPIDEIQSIFEETAQTIPTLLRHRSIEPSMAISCWGIATIAKRHDILKSLQVADPQRLGSQHGVPRYMRMLTSLFSAMQAISEKDINLTLRYIAEFDRDSQKSRTRRDFLSWSNGLKNILVAGTKKDTHEIDAAINARCTYLDTSYTSKTDLEDHEALLDVHGIGVLSAIRLSGLEFYASGTTLPKALLKE